MLFVKPQKAVSLNPVWLRNLPEAHCNLLSEVAGLPRVVDKTDEASTAPELAVMRETDIRSGDLSVQVIMALKENKATVKSMGEGPGEQGDIQPRSE